ncbi:MAG: putative Zn-finger protein [Halocynthiibacter sp.]
MRAAASRSKGLVSASMPIEAQYMTIQAPETEIVTQWRVACDGGEGALGHPRVWLQIPEDQGFVECGYCDKKFVHESAKMNAAK